MRGLFGLVLAGFALAACGSSPESESEGVSPSSKEWVVSYQEQLDGWASAARRIEGQLKRREFSAARKTFKRRLLHGGRDARKKFLRVPEDVQDADKLYRMIVTTGDAASQWALAVVRDPPPYGEEELDKAEDWLSLRLLSRERSTGITRPWGWKALCSVEADASPACRLLRLCPCLCLLRGGGRAATQAGS